MVFVFNMITEITVCGFTEEHQPEEFHEGEAVAMLFSDACTHHIGRRTNQRSVSYGNNKQWNVQYMDIVDKRAYCLFYCEQQSCFLFLWITQIDGAN